MSETCGVNNAVVPKAAFAFCRYSMAIALWLAFAFKIKELVVLMLAVLVLSAILGISRAPLVWLYTVTVNRVFRSSDESLSVGGMRFAHSMGAAIGLFCVLTLYLGKESVGWWVVLGYAVIKTISALGACPAYKLYGCVAGGGCCSFLRKKEKTQA